MAEEQFYIANLSPSVSEDDIKAMFSEYGEVIQVERVTNTETGVPRDKAAIKLQFDDSVEDHQPTIQKILVTVNGQELAERRLSLTHSAIPDKPPTDEDRKYVGKLAEQLGETGRVPLSQMLRMVHMCSIPFVDTLLQETERIEAEGGMLINDGTRRRTKGGVFFYLARRRMPVRFQRVIFQSNSNKQGQKDKKPGPQQGKDKRPPQQKGKAPQGKGKRPPQQQGKAPQGKGKRPPQQQQDKGPRPAQQSKPQANKPQPAAPEPVPAKRKRTMNVSPEKLAEARQQLSDLRQKQQSAQQRLEELKAMPQSERKSGLFSATREVVNIQKQITNLLRQYPNLDD